MTTEIIEKQNRAEEQTAIHKEPEQYKEGLFCISKYIRTIAKIICCVFPAADLICAIIKAEPWYTVLLYIAAGIIVAIAFSGMLVFLLKLMLFFVRKRAVKRAEQIETLNSDFELSKLRDAGDPTNENAVSQINQYTDTVIEIKQKKIELQVQMLRRDKYAEWQWVVAGIIAASIVIGIITAFYIITIGLVLLMVLGAFIATHPTYDDGYRGYDTEKEERDPWFIRLFDRLWGKIEEKDKEAEQEIVVLSSEIAALQASNEAILHELCSSDNILQ